MCLVVAAVALGVWLVPVVGGGRLHRLLERGNTRLRCGTGHGAVAVWPHGKRDKLLKAAP